MSRQPAPTTITSRADSPSVTASAASTTRATGSRKPSGALVRSSKAVPPFPCDGSHPRVVTGDQVGVHQRPRRRAYPRQRTIAVMRDLPELATHDDVGGPVRAPLVHHRQSRVELSL